MAALTSLIVFTRFGSDPAGIRDAFLALVPYTDRAGGGDHAQPWFTYLRILTWPGESPGPIWSEGLTVLLACVGGASVLGGSGERPVAFGRFILLYTVLVTAIYSAIPYKTPWNIVQILVPVSLLAGVGVSYLWDLARRSEWRIVLIVLLVVGCGHLAYQARAAAFRFASDRRNPYAYVQPLGDVVDLGRWIARLAELHPDGSRMVVCVIANNPWPVPWYLRRLERVGYWEDPPEWLSAPVVVVSSAYESEVEHYSEARMVTLYGLRRPEVLYVCVEQALYDRFVAAEEKAGPR